MRGIQTWIPLITLVFHIGWCYVIFNVFQMKIEGAAIIQTLQFWTNWLILELVIQITEAKKHVRWFTKESFQGWTQMGIDSVSSVIYEILNRI